jgi:uncharacterized protein (TIGR02186 family)
MISGLAGRLALAVCLLGLSPARAEDLITTLSSEKVAITQKFGGADIALFGAIGRDAATVARSAGYDVVVTVKGPRGQVIVREKRQLGPLWLNLDQRKYIAIPAFIAVLSNRPLTDICDPERRSKLKLGIDPLVPAQGDRTLKTDPDEPDFRQALIRLRKAEKLFREDSGVVRFLSPNLFQTEIRVPGTAPLGAYDVEVAVFAEGVPLTKATLGFQVIKEGIEHRITEMAYQHALFYGLLAALMAVAIGWFATVIFRRE